MKQLIDNILEQPNASAIAEQVLQKLEAEQKSRLQFYNNITENDKVEFINGNVVIHSPVMWRHSKASFNLANLLNNYVNKHKLGAVCHEKIMITLTRNDYEPDICFFKKEKAQHFKEDQCLFPAPDLVVEVLSKSTEKNDRGIKYKDYEAHQITEYWIVDPLQKTIEQYQLNDEQQYELTIKSTNGIVHSTAVNGFHFAIEAIFDDYKNSEELSRILA